LVSGAEIVQMTAAVPDHDELPVVIQVEVDAKEPGLLVAEFDVRDDLHGLAFVDVPSQVHELLVLLRALAFGHREVES